MKWIKATERLPENPGQYLFRVLGGGYNDDTAYYVKSISKEELGKMISRLLEPQKHEWLDESSESPIEYSKETIVVSLPNYEQMQPIVERIAYEQLSGDQMEDLVAKMNLLREFIESLSKRC